VARKLLERDGGEVALATSIVRYQAGSRFARHTHDLGEEFLVLQGVFCDERDQYPAGTYVHNPPGSSHAPFSTDGCVIFVKLRYMTPDEADLVIVRPEDRTWLPAHGCDRAELYRSARTTVALERLPPGARRSVGDQMGGEEILIVDGQAATVADPSQVLRPWSWLRGTSSHGIAIRTRTPVMLWVKQSKSVEENPAR
jgi:hypothetical protein